MIIWWLLYRLVSLNYQNSKVYVALIFSKSRDASLDKYFSSDFNSINCKQQTVDSVSLMSSDLCEDAEIRQKILDMKDEIETNKASRTKDSVRRSARHTSRS